MVAEDSRWAHVASVKPSFGRIPLSIPIPQRLLRAEILTSHHTLQFLHLQTKFASPRLPPISFISWQQGQLVQRLPC